MFGENPKKENKPRSNLFHNKMENSDCCNLKKEKLNFCSPSERNLKADNMKETDSQMLKSKIKAVTSLVKELEHNILEANQNDKQLFIKLQSDSVKNQILSSQLEDAKKENKQLMNALQQRFGDQPSSRTTSRSNLDVSYSTVSMVNLQYKYEELVANYEGLLNVLESKGREVNKCYSENEELRSQVKEFSSKLAECNQEIEKVCEKYLKLKQRKDRKINRLKEECKVLRQAHDNLVDMLNKFSLEQDREYQEELKMTKNPDKAVLLNEIRRSNKLQHENFMLQQEVNYLKNKLKLKDMGSRQNENFSNDLLEKDDFSNN